MLNQTTLNRGWVAIVVLCGLFGSVAGVCAADRKSVESKLEEWIEKVQNTSLDAETRLTAVDDIDMLRIRGANPDIAIPVLRQLLKDQSVAVRTKAARALFDFDEPAKTLLPPAIAALMDSDTGTRIDACYLLWNLEYQAAPAIQAIVEALDDNEAKVRSLAALVLGAIGPDFKQASTKPLTALLDDSDRSVRVSAAEALARVDGPIKRSVEVLVAAVRQSRAGNSKDGPGTDENETVEVIGQLGGDAAFAIPTLNESLKLGGTFRQTAAAKALRGIGPESAAAIDGLAVALRNGEAKGFPFVHRSWCASDDASDALAMIGVKAVPVLVAALSDADERVRANAADALGNIPVGANTSVSKLAELLTDDDPAVRSNAAWALGKLGRTPIGREAIERDSEVITGRLARMLFDDTEWNSAPAGGGIAQSFSVPWHAVEAIARIKPDQQQLIAALSGTLQREKTINFAAATTIASIGADGRSLTTSLKGLMQNKASRAAAAYAIASIDPAFDGLQESLESALIRTKKDWPDLREDREVDPVAARGLGLMGQRALSSVPRLKEAIRVADESKFVGYASEIIACCLAILQIDANDKHASRALLDALARSHSAFDAFAVDAAAKAIPKLISGQNHLRTMVIAELENADIEVRLRSTAYLTDANVAQPETIAALMAVARRGKFRLRGKAVDLLAKHGAAAKEAVNLLTEFLPDDGKYRLGGDFYGNGGTRHTVSAKAVAALAAIGRDAIPALRKQLDDPHHRIREAAATSLGLVGTDAGSAVDRLIELTEDNSHHVRRASTLALGRIASKQRPINPKLLAALKRSGMDQRHAVRHASRVALQLVE